MEQAWSVGKRCYRDTMTVRKLSVALEEAVASGASRAAERRGMSLSGWLNTAAARALVLEEGLEAVRAWEEEHGALSDQELTWADAVLDAESDPLQA